MKFAELPTKGKSGRPLAVENAVIESVSMTVADHGILTSYLHMRMDGTGCGFGGYCLGKTSSSVRLDGQLDYAAEFIVRCLRVAGVDEWSNLEGRNVRVLTEGLGGGIVAIGHIIKDDWFCPRVEWEKQG